MTLCAPSDDDFILHFGGSWGQDGATWRQDGLTWRQEAKDPPQYCHKYKFRTNFGPIWDKFWTIFHTFFSEFWDFTHVPFSTRPVF